MVDKILQLNKNFDSTISKLDLQLQDFKTKINKQKDTINTTYETEALIYMKGYFEDLQSKLDKELVVSMNLSNEGLSGELIFHLHAEMEGKPYPVSYVEFFEEGMDKEHMYRVYGERYANSRDKYLFPYGMDIIPLTTIEGYISFSDEYVKKNYLLRLDETFYGEIDEAGLREYMILLEGETNPNTLHLLLKNMEQIDKEIKMKIMDNEITAKMSKE